MNISEELSRLESGDLAVLQRVVQQLRSSLGAVREPELLNELVDYQLHTGSETGLRILTSLKDLHSQDFFAKLHDCLLRKHSRLPALRLLAHMLNGQASWLYKTVDSPVFPVLLQLLRSSPDLIVLTSTVYILCALIPLSPFRISKHLPDIFEIFTRLATLKSTINKLPLEIYLGLDIAVFYLFLQLYALYPCMFINYLKARFGPTGEVDTYNETIAPLFHHVQLHPNLVTELPSQEKQKSKWRSREPHEIGTLALSLCIDPNLVQFDIPTPEHQLKELKKSHQHTLSEHSQVPSCNTFSNTSTFDSKYCGSLEASEMATIWSPMATFGQVTPVDTPGNISRLSHVTNLSSPHSESCTSANSSIQTTPLPVNNSTYKFTFNYSPTASVEGDAKSIMSNMTSETHPPQRSPLSSRNTSGRSSPIKSASSTSVSLRERFSNFFRKHNTKSEREEFTNISVSDFHAAVEAREELIQSEVLPTCNKSVKEDLSNSLHITGFQRLSSSSPPLPIHQTEQVIPREISSCSVSIGDSGSGSDECHERLSLSAPITTTLEPIVHTQLPSSYPVIDSSIQEKLEQLANEQNHKSLDSSNEIPHLVSSKHRPSFITFGSFESSATLTPQEEETKMPLLLPQTVSSEKKSCHGNIQVCSPLSPVGALDQYICNGHLLYLGKPKEIPLTKLEGIDWDHYGGCPHSEELGVQTALSVMLHSQVLFERHQCQLHARRNRQLMNKARTTSKLENEILALRCRLHHQEELISNLQSEKLISSPESKVTNDKLLTENKQLHVHNSELKNEVERLKQEMTLMKRKNKELTQNLQTTLSLEEENIILKAKLSETSKLQTQIESMMKEQLVVEELYHQQKLTMGILCRENTELHQLQSLNETLNNEKEGFQKQLHTSKKDLKMLKALVREKDEKLVKQEKEILELRNNLAKLQKQCHDKNESIERKYQSIKNINQCLEESILQLKGRSKSIPSNAQKRDKQSSPFKP